MDISQAGRIAKVSGQVRRHRRNILRLKKVKVYFLILANHATGKEKAYFLGRARAAGDCLSLVTYELSKVESKLLLMLENT